MSILVMLTVWLVVLSLELGLGLGIGWLIHWAIPSIDIGIGSLIAVLAVVTSARFLGWLISAIASASDDTATQEYFEDRDETSVVHILDAAPWRRVRRRKKLRK